VFNLQKGRLPAYVLTHCVLDCQRKESDPFAQ
jgi:hypothetical protein